MSFLSRILEEKREEVASRKRLTDLKALEEISRAGAPPVSLLRSLTGGGVAVIAEIKRASPSAGLLRERFLPSDHAKEYERAGARAVSVLTDAPFFQGSLDHLRQVRKVTSLPVLRKDFILDRFQLLEARAAGADAVLLIAAALRRDSLGVLIAETESLGMEALVEVHDEEEMASLEGMNVRLVGINNRNLRTFVTDLATSIRLVPLAPQGALVVSESGIRTGNDVRLLQSHGVQAVLVGELFMRAPDPGAALRELLSGAAS